MNSKKEIINANIHIKGNIIKAINQKICNAKEVIDAKNRVVIPGLIQSHVHLCQTLFRGRAENMRLLEWLKKKIWKFESLHDKETVYHSACLGIAELLKSGTTTILDMGTSKFTSSTFEAARKAGIRAIIGNAMMDCGRDVPHNLKKDSKGCIKECMDLIEKWHGTENDRLQYAISPRFALTCSERLLKEIARISEKYDLIVHTHCAESKSEVELIVKDKGLRNVNFLQKMGLVGERVKLAHCIWLDDTEMDILATTKTKVLHCPSSNLKLSSGIARVPEMLKRGIEVSLGSDGAACNNNLDIFFEMRLAALVSKYQYGPAVMPASQVFGMAALEGAKCLDLNKEIGSIEEGKKADLVILDLRGIHNCPDYKSNIYSKIVYSVNSSDVKTTIVDGRIVMRERRLTTLNERDLMEQANKSLAKIIYRT